MFIYASLILSVEVSSVNASYVNDPLSFFTHFLHFIFQTAHAGMSSPVHSVVVHRYRHLPRIFAKSLVTADIKRGAYKQSLLATAVQYARRCG